jgi:hypothetical protein
MSAIRRSAPIIPGIRGWLFDFRTDGRRRPIFGARHRIEAGEQDQALASWLWRNT